MWIELHDSSRDHPKIIKLARVLKIHQAQALGHMVSIWTWALRMCPDGDLSSFDDDDIEIGAMWSGEPGALVAAAEDLRLLDRNDDGNFIIHDWDDFSGSLKAAKRAREYRKRKRDASVTRTLRKRDITQNDQTRPERPDQTDQNTLSLSLREPDRVPQSPPEESRNEAAAIRQVYEHY